MTITLPLQPQEEARLAAVARARGLSPDDFLCEVVQRALAAAPPPAGAGTAGSRPIWEVLLDNMDGISPEEFAVLPKDGAGEHDHYLYGHPKTGK